jgi:hypothetical protein
LESRALSASNFPAFAETVVPYLNVASHLDGVPYDNLLQEKGFGGYPSLAFMDEDGNVIGKPSDRTVSAFSDSRDALMVIDAVRAKAEAGDQKAQVKLLFLEFTLGNIKADDLTSGIKALSQYASAEQIAKAEQIGIDALIYDLYVAGFNEPDGDSTEKIIAMLHAGQLPTPGSLSCNVFWSTIGRHAQKTGDTALLRRVVKGMKEDLAEDKRSQDMAASLERTAIGLEERDKLTERKESGEANLEAKILLLEAQLDAVSFEAFQGRLAAAIAVASEDEKAELLQAGVDLETNTLIGAYWGRGDKGPIYTRLFELLEDSTPGPSENLMGLISMPINNYIRSVKDPAVLEAHAAAISKRYGSESPMQNLVKSLTKGAQTLREDLFFKDYKPEED